MKEVKRQQGSSIQVSDEDIGIAFAWITDKISIKQLGVSYNMSAQGGQLLYRIAVILKEAHKRGRVKLK